MLVSAFMASILLVNKLSGGQLFYLMTKCKNYF